MAHRARPVHTSYDYNNIEHDIFLNLYLNYITFKITQKSKT